ncbi:MAG: MFS transporter [Candidatus Cloacimonetes bacterium]|nr:MFS transporter [Candidatus Cloacimonadota bacterium]
MSRDILGWALYDFANSAFVTVIVTVVYSRYYQSEVVGDAQLGSALWGRAVSLSMLLVGLAAPVLGAIADYTHSKKRAMVFFCYLSVLFTLLLWFVRPGDIWLGFGLFVVANFGFNAGNVFYNAFLPDITTRRQMGRVSGFGWSLGYVGGLLALVMALGLVREDVRLVFPAVGAFFGVFATITFVLLREKKGERSGGVNYLRIGFTRMRDSLRHIRRLRELVRFLLSYLIYNDGITTVIAFAAIYGGKRFGMKLDDLIIYFIIANLSSIVGAFVFGHVLDRIGARRTITITLFIWTVVVLWAFFCRSITEYYFVGVLAGIAIGASQSSSRTMLALLTPSCKMSEFFGFYAFSGKMAAVVGPLIYGEIDRLTVSDRLPLLSVLVFIIVGGLLLQTVNERKGRLAAEGWEELVDS